MSSRFSVAFVLIGFVVLLFMGCQRGAIIEGGAEEAKKPEVIEEEMGTLEDLQAAREREQIEASLQTKRYPGIEGEVFESSLIQDIHFAFDESNVLTKHCSIKISPAWLGL